MIGVQNDLRRIEVQAPEGALGQALHRIRLGEELPRSVYEDKHGREKVVRYWEMTVKKGSFQPNDEVDEVRWLRVDEARRRLSYPRDEDVLDAFAARVPGRLPAR